MDGDSELFTNNQMTIDDFRGLHFVILKDLTALKGEGIPRMYKKGSVFQSSRWFSKYKHHILRVADAVEVIIEANNTNARILEPENIVLVLESSFSYAE